MTLDLQIPMSWDERKHLRETRGRSQSLDFPSPFVDERQMFSYMPLEEETEVFDKSLTFNLFQEKDVRIKPSRSFEAEGEFEGSFVGVEMWKTEYQGNYRKSGGKTLRCFPFCHPVHQNSSFCGDSVKFSLKKTSHQMGGFLDNFYSAETKFCVFAEFVEIPNSSKIKVGERVSRDVLLEKISAPDSTVWWPGVLASNSGERTRRNYKFKANSRFCELNETQLSNGIVLEFNKERRAWHYASKPRSLKKNKHSLKIMIFSYISSMSVNFNNNGQFLKNVTDIETLDLRCEAVFHSPSFEIFSRKNRSRKTSEIEKSDTLSEAIDSFVDSMSEELDFEKHIRALEDFDATDFDSEFGSLRRKRSFLHSFESSANYVEDVCNSWNSDGLKRMRSAKDLSDMRNQYPEVAHSPMRSTSFYHPTTSHSFNQKPEHLMPTETFGSVPRNFAPRLMRSASAPNLNTKPDKDKISTEDASVIMQLFEDIISQKKDRFVNVVTKFLLSENETLTLLLQSSIASMSEVPEDMHEQKGLEVLATCYAFLKNNFPPFSIYAKKCVKAGAKPDLKIISKLAEKVVRRNSLLPQNSVAPTPCVSFEIQNLMDSFRGSWQFPSQHTTADFFRKIGYSEADSSCLASMESKIFIDFEPNCTSVILKNDAKLFSSGVRRVILDDTLRDFDEVGPLLLSPKVIQKYKSSVDFLNSEISIEYFLQDSSLSAKRVYKTSKGLLESCLTVHKRASCGKLELLLSTRVFASRM